MNSPEQQEILDVALALIHSRQHVSTKRLGDPGPTPEQVEKILAAAGAAPDHGQINPWRLVIIPGERRQVLAEAFADALVERDAAATDAQKEEARQKAYRAPFLVMVIARLDPALGKAHPQERLVSAGCAVQNMLLAAHAMGLGAGLSSGRGLYSQAMRRLFGLNEHEQPLCFLAVGTVTRPKTGGERPGFRRYSSEL
jgi:nitroreductase